MQVVRYTESHAAEWDGFVTESKNGTFLFMRGYMDYHSDRFTDHSLMFYGKGGRLVALLPANMDGTCLYSHRGLTYGGFVLHPHIHLTEVGELFELTISYLRSIGVKAFVYKQIPSVYHRLPCQEDTYWLWRYGFVMRGCGVMTAIDLRCDGTLVSQRRRSYCNKLRRQGGAICMDAALTDFWPVLEANLRERFGAAPVHTLDEISLLRQRFPENIRCCTVRDERGMTLAGTVLFVSGNVVRTQYISASPEGRKCNALDLLLTGLTDEFRRDGMVCFFEFGTSMADDGIGLNEGLVMQKEGLGGRSIACPVYRLDIRENL